MDKLERFRQPMVTVTGIMLGFILDFASRWVTDTFAKHRFREILVSVSLTVTITILLIVLYRVFKLHHPEADMEKYYRRTVALFLTGVSMPFITLLILMLDTLLKS